jgi:hypothetical protein
MLQPIDWSTSASSTDHEIRSVFCGRCDLWSPKKTDQGLVL